MNKKNMQQLIRKLDGGSHQADVWEGTICFLSDVTISNISAYLWVQYK